ncbi:NHL domain-containing protein [Alkaliphilus peptidifermentans]|uniref:Diguanylate cyclase (GGDEF) domain-containing protein n=1 Tax=Alkaliphilus peptidifermentans DSM 18978 TaxID=1120976 RepID=A0A1G5K5J5_9FIRM|nr:diguanylate cyclase [Alkaliphilus peptidifermentans]SCY95912.1 diguanylate cyclase (GGDEF) domain-containing protein [Alkaliphilus peptidifermentans DSM 18978]
MIWPIDEITNIAVKSAHNNKPYGIAVIDIDYMIRFCRAFTNEELNMIKENFLCFFKEMFPNNSKIWQSSGDEFLILIPKIAKADAFQLTDRIRRVFKRNKFAVNTDRAFKNITFSFSAGVAAYPQDGDNVEEIIRRATIALFLSKAFRRNRVYPAPDEGQQGVDRILAMPDGKIHVLAGKYGEIGDFSVPIKCQEARFWEPQAIDIDEEGNLYILDQNNHTVLKYNGENVYRVAGDGYYGYTGDGGDAALARLNKPTGLAISKRRLYITDTGNDAVRVVELDSGIIKTIAGTGETGYSGDGAAGYLATLNKPGGAAVDLDGNLYINDIANNVIRRVDKKGIITTYAGSGEYGFKDECRAIDASFAEIYGICTDKTNSNLYIADYFNHCIRVVDYNTGIVARVAGTGECGYKGDGEDPLKACLNRPVAVTSDIHGNLFIAESGNHCIRMIAAATGKIYTLVGDGVYGIGESEEVSKFRLANPNGLAVDNSFHLYILDGANNRICMMDYSQIIAFGKVL